MQAASEPPTDDVSASTSSGSLAKFQREFERLEANSAPEAAKCCLLYMAQHGSDPLGRSSASWVTAGPIYLSVLLDVESLAPDVACRAIQVLREADSQFSIRFAKTCAALTSPAGILRALGLVQALGDYSILIAWLRALGPNSDARVRSRSAKLLCLLRPNKGLIHQQLKSTESRIRAGVMEVLWHAAALLDQEEIRSFLRAGLADSHHRVVANALVGLHLLGDSEASHKMIELCGHKQHLFRASMAWALGRVKEQRGISALQGLLQDPSFTVRERAKDSLSLIAKAAEVEQV